MARGSGETVYKIKVQAVGVASIDSITQAAVVATGAVERLAKAGAGLSPVMRDVIRQQAAAAVQMRAQAQATQAQAAMTRANTEAGRAAVAQARAQIAAQKGQTAATDAAATAAKANSRVTADYAVALGGLRQRLTDGMQSAVGYGNAVKGAAVAVGGGISSAMGYAGALMSVTQQAGEATTALYNFAAEGQKLKQMDIAFKTLGGNAKELEGLRVATGGVVDDATLKRVYNLGSLFELPQDKIKDLIRLAKGASVALGTTTAKALEDTFTAASRQSKMIADNMGIVIGDMRQMYEEYAKKLGKSVDELTDKEKQRAFVLRMIEKGTRQISLAQAAADNAYASTEAAAKNWLDAMKIGFAEVFVSSGMLQSMNDSFGVFQGMLAGAGSDIIQMLVPAFKALMGALPAVGQLFGSLAPLLLAIGPALTIITTALQLLSPILGGAIYLLSSMVKIILELVGVALMAFLKVLREIGGIVSDEFAASIDKAITTLDKGIAPIEAQTAALDGQKEKLEEVARNWNILDEVQRRIAAADSAGKHEQNLDSSQLAARLGVTAPQLEEINKNMEKFKSDYLARTAYLASSGIGQAEIIAMDADTQRKLIASSGKTEAQIRAIRDKARTEIASDLAAKIGMERKLASAVLAIEDRTAEEATTVVRNEQAAREALRQADLDNLQRMAADELGFATSTLAAMVSEGAKNEEEALAKLEVFYAKHMDYVAALRAENKETSAAMAEETLASLTNSAADAITKQFEKKKKTGGGRKGDGGEAAIREAYREISIKEEREILEIRERFSDLAKKIPQREAWLKAQLAEEAEGRIIELQAERMRREADARAQAVVDQKAEARALSQFMMGEYQARLQAVKDTINDEADARRAALTRAPVVDLSQVAAVEAQRMRLIAKAEADAMVEGLQGAFAPMAEAWQGYRVTQKEAMDRDLRDAATWANAVQGMSGAIVDSLFSIMNGSQDAREGIFKIMGQVFGQLSTAFLAWATAEGNLLAGNPWGAAAAAIALGVVASAISAFGSRKPASGGSKSAAKSSIDNDADRRSKDAPAGTTINVFGFATPDAISNSTRRGNKRGDELNGRGVA